MRRRELLGVAAAAVAATALPFAAAAAGPKDMVGGAATFDIDDSRVTLHARSDAAGGDARGRYSIVINDPDPALTSDPSLSFSGDVVCLAVADHEAVVGAIVTASSDTDAIAPGTGLLHYVVDDGPSGPADASITLPFAPASSCADYLPWPGDLPAAEPAQTGNWTVRDR
jgi:hypothetical protein